MREKIKALIKYWQQSGRLTRHQAYNLVTDYDKLTKAKGEQEAFNATMHQITNYLLQTI